MRASNRRKSDQKRNIGKVALERFATIQLGVLAVAAFLFFGREALPASSAATLTVIYYVLTCVGMTLSAWFNRSRVFYVLLLLLLVQTADGWPVPAGLDPFVFGMALYYFSCLLPFITILVLAFVRERGLLSPGGKVIGGFILLQLMFAAVVIMSQDKDMLALINREILFPPDIARQTPVPFTPLAVAFVAFAMLGCKQLLKKSPVENAFFYVLPVLAAAFHFKSAPIASPLFFATAGAMLMIATIKESYALAYLDELTGLPGRRALQDEMAQLGDIYTIAMVDIDYFKKFNDKYGHDVGDDALRLVSAMAKEIKGGGHAFRYGGEEFAVLFAGKGLEEALPFLEELREQIARRPFFLRVKQVGEKRLSITVSIGAAEKAPGHKLPEEVLKAADEALYRAKGNGRNCVCS